ncbi:MAG: GAF domain-containing protein, partial [Roseiflexaceae bacterium]|nr:GAF domain-containing protein [Roseiflexaceae bacterium]
MTEPAHILVVDDDANIRRMLQILLADAGYRVSCASTGEEALAYVELVTPDLIMLDLMLPGINGSEVAERIKANPQRPFIPIILVTARSDSRSKVSALDAGADDYLSKPVEFSELLARVRALLRLQRSQRSLHAEQRKTELLLHLTRELGTTLDLDELLTHFLAKLADSISAVRGSLILTLGNRTRFYSSSRYQASAALGTILSGGVAGWVLREQQPLVIADTQNDPRWVIGTNNHSPIRSAAAVPILREGQAIGVITVVHHTPNHFSAEHQDLLVSVAQQSAFTLENAELFRLSNAQKELLERRADELQRLNEISHHLSELMQPELLLRLVAHLVHHTFGYEQVALIMREANGAQIKEIAGGADSELYEGMLIPPGRGLVNWVIAHREPLCSGDVRTDPRYFSFAADQDPVRSELVVPIIAGREIFGALSVASPHLQAYGTSDERLLGTLASQIGIALENAR